MSLDLRANNPPIVIGRYALYDKMAAGGMATVHFGRLNGAMGFSRLVAVKRLHPEFACDSEFVSMFVDEARLAVRIRHPNVVPTLDVVATESEVFLVLEYVHGESLSRLLRPTQPAPPVPVPITCAVLCGVLSGLHAAHEATDTQGKPIGLVHRDVSPQNVIVGVDGIARVLDFGIALALGRKRTTGQGKLKGKFGYMAPEHANGDVTRQADVFAAGIVLWEALAGRRLFGGESPRESLQKIRTLEIPPPSSLVAGVPDALDAVVLRSLERDLAKRYATAREMAIDLEACVRPASLSEVGAWVATTAHDALAERKATIADLESSWSTVADVPESLAFGGDRASAADNPADIPTVPGVVSPSSARIALGNDLSTISDGVTTSRRSTWRSRIALICGVAILVGVGVVVATRRSAQSQGAASAATAGSPVATASASASAVAISPTAAEAPTATALPPAPSAADSSAVRRPVGPRSPGPPKRTAAPVDCTPPFSLDAQGHKRWKPQCF